MTLTVSVVSGVGMLVGLVTEREVEESAISPSWRLLDMRRRCAPDRRFRKAMTRGVLCLCVCVCVCVYVCVSSM